MDGSERLNNSAPLPRCVDLMVFAGANGEAELFEDNGLIPNDAGYRSLRTAFTMLQEDGLHLTIHTPQGDISLLPDGRHYAVHITGTGDAMPAVCLAGGKACTFAANYNNGTGRLTIKPNVSGEQKIELIWRAASNAAHPNCTEEIKSVLCAAQISVPLKEAITRIIEKPQSPMTMVSELNLLVIPPVLFSAIVELLSASSL